MIDLPDIPECFIESIKKDVELNGGNSLNWSALSINYKLSEEFLFEYKDFVKWDYIGRYQKLSINFVKKVLRYIVWVSLNELTLTEDFIREFKDKVNWYWISYKAFLSREFIVEFADKISFDALMNNKNISQDIKDYCRIFV